MDKKKRFKPGRWLAASAILAAGLFFAIPKAQPVYAYTGFSAVSDVVENDVSVKKFGYYSLSFDGNDATDGSIETMKELRIDEKVTLPANVFTRKGFTFLGWSRTKQDPFSGTPSAEYTDKSTIDALSDTDGTAVTLYAVWQRNTITATYHSNLPDGTEQTVTQTFLTGDTSAVANENSFEYPASSAAGREFDLSTPGTYKWVVPVTGDYTFEMAGGSGGDGGGLAGGSGSLAMETHEFVPSDWYATGGSQTSGGQGYGSHWDSSDKKYSYFKTYGGFGVSDGNSVTGGFGWYSGSCAYGDSLVSSGSGGSSYISGYAGTTPFDQIPGGGSVQKSHQFTDMTMTGGKNEGAGYVKIITPAGITHRFSEWNSSADGQGTNYETGSSLANLTSDIEFYAQWEDVPWSAPVNTEDKSEGIVEVFDSEFSDNVDVITTDELDQYADDCEFLLYVDKHEDSTTWGSSGVISGTLRSHLFVENGTLEELSDNDIAIMREAVKTLDGETLYPKGYSKSGTSENTYAYYRVIPTDKTKQVKVYTDYVSTHVETGISGTVYALRTDRFTDSGNAKRNTLSDFETNYSFWKD